MTKLFLSDDASRRDEAVPDKSYSLLDYIVNMLCSKALGCGEEGKEKKVCEIRGHLPAQQTAVKLQTETVDIRALSARDLRKKVDESDNLSHEQKGNLFHMLSKYRANFTSKRGLCELFAYELEVQWS